MSEPQALSDYETRMKVVDALDALLMEKPYEKVSVKEICEQAGISRATFYRHFDSKMAVPQWLLKYAHEIGTDEIGRSVGWQTGWFITETLVSKYGHLFDMVTRQHDYNSVDRYTTRARKKVLLDTLEFVKGVKITDSIRMQVDAIIALEIKILPRWHKGKYDFTLQEMCEKMAEIAPQELFELLDAPQAPYHRNAIMHWAKRPEKSYAGAAKKAPIVGAKTQAGRPVSTQRPGLPQE